MRSLLRWLAAISGLTITAQASATETSQHFARDQALDGFIRPSGFNGDKFGHSLHDCGITCLSLSSCTSFFYVFSSQHCQVHDTIFTHTTGLIGVHSAVYFVAEHEPPALFECPPDDSIFRTVLLDDGSTVTYRAFRNAINQADATLECSNQGGRLLQVLTEARNSFAINLLMCTGYGIGEYWIDGSNAGATDFTDLNGWTTSDGITLPTQFWHSSQPNSPTLDHCLAMYQGFNYEWSDRICTSLHNYICEIP